MVSMLLARSLRIEQERKEQERKKKLQEQEELRAQLSYADGGELHKQRVERVFKSGEHEDYSVVPAERTGRECRHRDCERIDGE